MLMEIASRAGFEMSRTLLTPIVSLNEHSGLKMCPSSRSAQQAAPLPPIFQSELNDPPIFLPNTHLASSLLG